MPLLASGLALTRHLQDLGFVRDMCLNERAELPPGLQSTDAHAESLSGFNAGHAQENMSLRHGTGETRGAAVPDTNRSCPLTWSTWPPRSSVWSLHA